MIDGERERERERERLQWEMAKVQQTIVCYLGSFHTCLLNNELILEFCIDKLKIFMMIQCVFFPSQILVIGLVLEKFQHF